MIIDKGTSSNSSRKKQAIQYARRGWLVVPMHTIKNGKCSCPKGNACERAGKHPMTQHGVNDATTNRSRIRNWWVESPDANIGIAAGSESGIIVLDIDPRNGGYKSLKRLKEELGPLPNTVTSRTGGGGRHHVFKYPSFAVRKDTSGKKFGKGVDILSDGCIMVAPPSRHVTGKRYRWKEGKSYRDLEPATLPKSWLDHLRRSGSAESGKDDPSAKTDGRILEGQRNTHLTSLAGTLQRGAVSPAAITAALIEENKAKCSPPLDKSEIEKIEAPILIAIEQRNAVERILDPILSRFGIRHTFDIRDVQIRDQVIVESTGNKDRFSNAVLDYMFPKENTPAELLPGGEKSPVDQPLRDVFDTPDLAARLLSLFVSAMAVTSRTRSTTATCCARMARSQPL
jgi:hypothetical protein